MSYNSIQYDLNDGVAIITLNRPAVLNALNDLMIEETIDACKRSGRDGQVRCLIITGNGRGFSSGQDLGEVRSRGEEFSFAEHLRQSYHRLIKQMVTLEKPIIGAINGIAAGAGCGIALATDLRVASDKASFMLAFSRIGLVPDSGTNWFLPRLVGYARAYEMAVTGDKVGAAQAYEWGMVNRVVPHDQLMESTTAWALTLANGPTMALGLTKRGMNKSWEMSLAEALTYESYLQEVAGNSHDYSEGIQAFLEKRAANFQGS